MIVLEAQVQNSRYSFSIKTKGWWIIVNNSPVRWPCHFEFLWKRNQANSEWSGQSTAVSYYIFWTKFFRFQIAALPTVLFLWSLVIHAFAKQYWGLGCRTMINCRLRINLLPQFSLLWEKLSFNNFVLRPISTVYSLITIKKWWCCEKLRDTQI